MATLLDYKRLYGESELNQRIEMALALCVSEINKESDKTPNHANRLYWAKDFCRHMQARVMEMKPAIISQFNPLKKITDKDIQEAAYAVIDLFADGT